MTEQPLTATEIEQGWKDWQLKQARTEIMSSGAMVVPDKLGPLIERTKRLLYSRQGGGSGKAGASVVVSTCHSLKY
jgi:hypothetical protein